MNELLFFVMMVLHFGTLMMLYRFLGRLGVFVWIPIATILGNIQVLKVVELFGVTATLGNMAYASLFLATDILSENYSRNDSVKAVLLGFVVLVVMMVIMTVAVAFVPGESDYVQASMRSIFSVMPRITCASLVAYALSQTNDIFWYHFWKNRKPSRGYLWLRNNFSTIFSQLLDSVVFGFLAFWGTFPVRDVASIVVTTFAMKLVAALLDTPCIYLAEHWFKNGKIQEG